MPRKYKERIQESHTDDEDFVPQEGNQDPRGWYGVCMNRINDPRELKGELCLARVWIWWNSVQFGWGSKRCVPDGSHQVPHECRLPKSGVLFEKSTREPSSDVYLEEAIPTKEVV